MAVIKGLEWTFDTAAEVYEKMRPGYVEELYQDIFQYIPVDESSNVVEIGIGGGQKPLRFSAFRIPSYILFLPVSSERQKQNKSSRRNLVRIHSLQILTLPQKNVDTL